MTAAAMFGAHPEVLGQQDGMSTLIRHGAQRTDRTDDAPFGDGDQDRAVNSARTSQQQALQPHTLLQCHTVNNMVMTMASKQVTITVDEALLSWFEQKAAHTGGKLSPTIARAARNWMLWEDAARLAEADQRAGRNTTDHAEAELAAQREAEATEAGRGHAA